ncbi:glycosyltransferase [Pyrobaculum calidifontis]|uniref:Glycosyl transferase, group 1 n=1 Tax=Pyrobaculum calidifontis (strain DSM 21063 / JCM 11548 / VA1) TaxID=410359 RepID=A3MXT5_PYRCJ|nr:glycosyltransferase [Pyrobaculum calidifontis]ABO09452.1 glycosyl transferase, group 1 [Pyrobaculum calidifontis JCM 11548]
MSLVAHHYWGSPGGGQLVCAAAAYALDKAGLAPVLSGTFKFDPGKYVEWYGIDISKYPRVTLPVGAKAFGLWARLLVWLPAKRAVEKYRPRLIFTDEVAYKPIAGAAPLVEYIHFPFEVFIDPRFRGTGLAYGEDPYITERYSRFPLSLYWRIYVKLLPRYARENPFHYASLVLANSSWTADVAKEVYGERPTVLNPPIAPNVEVVESPRPFEEREPAVVMLGRFSQEKRYHWAVTEVAPRLVKEVPGAMLYIFGGAATPTLRAYMEEVKRLAEKSGVAHAVRLIPNAPRREINATMDRARAFFHATINEHWGIAVAEAMARGLPPVVHKSGGTWSDLAQGAGLGYASAEEAVEQLAKFLTDPKAWKAASAASVAKAKGLTLDVFAKKLADLVSAI